jgi:hypothetical protein
MSRFARGFIGLAGCSPKTCRPPSVSVTKPAQWAGFLLPSSVELP